MLAETQNHQAIFELHHQELPVQTAGKAVGLDIPLPDQAVHFAGWVIAELTGL
jgi:hypothetical protein